MVTVKWLECTVSVGTNESWKVRRIEMMLLTTAATALHRVTIISY